MASPSNMGIIHVIQLEIPDEVFSTGVLETCCSIEPKEGNIYAPIDGKISQLADTLHAIGIDAGGMEILLHVGVDAVDMNGDGFTNAVSLSQSAKKGDLLLTVDLEKIRVARHPATVIIVVTNTDDFASVEEVASGAVQVRDDILREKNRSVVQVILQLTGLPRTGKAGSQQSNTLDM